MSPVSAIKIFTFLFGGLIALQIHASEQFVDKSLDRIFYHRAFELALWAMPATDSFATREAVIRDLKGKPNDIAINTKPMDSDIHLVALQTPYLQGPSI